MGDVALVSPVLTSLRKLYPEVSVTMMTKPAYAMFFTHLKGLNMYTPDLKNRHKGLIGLIRLYHDIIKEDKIDYVIDLHNVIRSRILRVLFRLSGIRSSVIDKGRAEKRHVIEGKIRKPLKHTVERYCDAFGKAGFPLEAEKGPVLKFSPGINEKETGLRVLPGIINIGIAPFAKHELKMWPESNMIRLLELISEKHSVKYWLFGGMEESVRLHNFNEQVPGSTIVSGNLNLAEELEFMGTLDFMISMDSSNMHMAALSGTRVISIWGATDPITGFGAWQQPSEYSIRIPADELTCRPCTVYGKGKCRRGDFACMNRLTPEKVYEKILNLKLL